MSFLHVPSGFKPGGLFFRLAGAALAVALAAAPLSAETRLALIIGNAGYETAPALDNPSNDANDIAAALNGLGFRVMLGIDQSQDQMDTLIGEFGAAAATADVVLFFFAGHAFQVSEQNYLVPVDVNLAQADRVVSQTVPLGRVLDALGKAPGLKLLFLDACRDNPLDLDRDDSGGLARVGSAADFLIAYATQPGAVAYDGEGRNGTFTEALLTHIRTPQQDISEMMISVRKDVVARTGGQQIPWESSSLTRQFRFDEGPPTASAETIFYQVATRSADPDLLRLYLERYPDGAHVSEVLVLLAGRSEGGARRGLGDSDGDQLWDLAQRTRLRTLFESYLAQYPEGPHAAEARRMVAELPADEEAGAARRCELLATHPRDRTETTPGAPYELLAQNGAQAIQVCSQAMADYPEQPKYVALLARAYAASGMRERAVELYETAAKRGDLRAMVSLALLKETGDGLAQDPAGALALYEQAAAAGSADAAINLAVTLLEGGGGEAARGLDLMQQASQAGSSIATFNLGVLAQEGSFGDPADALPLFERAAREGEARGYRAAAVLLDEGRGVARDPGRAAVQLLLGVASDDGALLRELSTQAGNWRADTLASLQERLARVGLYDGPADGTPGPALDAALAGWRSGGFNASALSG
ncbi:caspase family protein [Pseudogemmobacter humi]|uniref:Caspase domain protein n=1 Tax=Pseudogemmobacter humi TaxID=2483812 RepID=A0A3P5XPC7_9RHOB|nr:caspase family protein [Pseudogemmobacter humi]VDC32763.1 Caspase domain protein [Pseudogemmobacter humi]